MGGILLQIVVVQGADFSIAVRVKKKKKFLNISLDMGYSEFFFPPLVLLIYLPNCPPPDLIEALTCVSLE